MWYALVTRDIMGPQYHGPGMSYCTNRGLAVLAAACSSEMQLHEVTVLPLCAQIMAIKEFGDRDVYVTEHNVGPRCRVRTR